MPQLERDLTLRPRDVRGSVQRYRALHDTGGGSVRDRKQHYAELVRGYYDLVTDFYEHGWGDSFHFAPRYGNEPFEASIRRHQHYLAQRLNLSSGMRVLDVGCGVGGPMREIARFSGVQVIGINNNAYQVQKARRYNRAARLDARCTLVEADFMQIPCDSGSLDAAYAFEATCHAPDKTALFREIQRVLRPGARFAIYEWCLTERYDPKSAQHRQIKRDIEEGNGLPDIWTLRQTEQCLRDAGFELNEVNDRAGEGDPELPWYHSLTGKELSNTGLRRSRLGQRAVRLATRVLETVRVAPRGSAEVADFLNVGADALVAGGQLGVFTPMAFFAAQKPV
jgi:sterol 24-C-methyltransferase